MKKQEITPQSPHCVLPKGYFDQILARIERKALENHEEETEFFIASPKTIVLEIEKWEAGRFG